MARILRRLRSLGLQFASLQDVRLGGLGVLATQARSLENDLLRSFARAPALRFSTTGERASPLLELVVILLAQLEQLKQLFFQCVLRLRAAIEALVAVVRELLGLAELLQLLLQRLQHAAPSG